MRPHLAPALAALLACSLLASEAKTQYLWLEHQEALAQGAVDDLQRRFPAPDGFQRIELAPHSFAAWLRTLPLLERSNVRSFDGRELDAPSAAVVALDVGSRDLQQCADSILRLRAEYLWAHDRSDEIAFHFTSGDLSSWKEWSKGERFVIGDGRVERERSATPSSGRASFEKYLWHLFSYASTRSMSKDAKAVPLAEPLLPGDFFVQGGSPGHAVLILDVAVDPDGRRVALLGQGFMPAQDFHVLTSSGARVLDGLWFLLPQDGESISTPSWNPFERSQALRFAEQRD